MRGEERRSSLFNLNLCSRECLVQTMVTVHFDVVWFQKRNKTFNAAANIYFHHHVNWTNIFSVICLL